jgi:predicted phosphodiesterase
LLRDFVNLLEIYLDLMIRVIIPDSHGSMIDPKARRAFLNDLKRLDPAEIVMLGDHVDAGGLFSKHKKKCREDMEYSYAEDIKDANKFLDDIQSRAPSAVIHYLEGNHEYHIERWASENLDNQKDVQMFVEGNAPQFKLGIKDRAIRYYRQMEFYHGLSIRNTIKLGHCYFTHGITAAKFATAKHVEKFGGNVVHGHTHRAQEYKTKTVRAAAIGGWCPGTLSILQPTYLHTEPSEWSHGYGVQFVHKKSGKFLHINVQIIDGESLLLPLTSTLHGSKSDKPPQDTPPTAGPETEGF